MLCGEEQSLVSPNEHVLERISKCIFWIQEFFCVCFLSFWSQTTFPHIPLTLFDHGRLRFSPKTELLQRAQCVLSSEGIVFFKPQHAHQHLNEVGVLRKNRTNKWVLNVSHKRKENNKLLGWIHRPKWSEPCVWMMWLPTLHVSPFSTNTSCIPIQYQHFMYHHSVPTLHVSPFSTNTSCITTVTYPAQNPKQVEWLNCLSTPRSLTCSR